MAGAIGLTGRAALRTGAGLVTVATPRSVQAVVAGFEPCYMTAGLRENPSGRLGSAALASLRWRIEGADAFAVGPGLGRGLDTQRLVTRLYDEAACPGVFDADGLFALARRRELSSIPRGPRILTPHEGELRRFVEGEVEEGREALERLAAQVAARFGAVVLLKGPGTLVTDGRRSYRNATGGPVLATGGSGDVLTGVIAALVARGLEAFEAAALGAFVHGRAGERAAAEIGPTGAIASDFIERLPAALAEVSDASGPSGG
jgi:NAD(P)H-hydrate epimerase